MSNSYEMIKRHLSSDQPAPLTWEEARAFVDELDPGERGRLMPQVWISRADDQSAGQTCRALAQFIRHNDPPPRFDANAAEEGIAALREIMDGPVPAVPEHSHYSPGQMHRMRLSGNLFLILSQLTDPFPLSAQGNLRDLLPILVEYPERTIVAAKLAADSECERAAIVMLLGNLDGEMKVREWSLFLKTDPETFLHGMLAFDHLRTRVSHEPRHEQIMSFLKSVPGYGEFAQEIMTIAVERFGLIASGEIPYKPDGAFILEDCEVIERAVLFGLANAETWCLGRISQLWRNAVIAPDPKAKTMPSQSISIRLANASVLEPRPEALLALQEAASLCRHAGVKKKLDRAKRAARTALAAHPDRMIDLPPDEPITKDLVRSFTEAIEGLLSRVDCYMAPDWENRFGPVRKPAWKLTSNLIWEISPGHGARSIRALPARRGKDLVWQSINAEYPFDPQASIRLWHPAESAATEARNWRSYLEQQGIQQPFLQAGREIYCPAPHEMSGSSISAFAGHDVSAVSLVGLSRVSGWYSGYQDELHLDISGYRFVFHAGVRVYHGSGDYGTTGNLVLTGPIARLDQVPPRILSEVMRKTDLLVTVGERHKRNG